MVVEILCHYMTQASSDQNKKGIHLLSAMFEKLHIAIFSDRAPSRIFWLLYQDWQLNP